MIDSFSIMILRARMIENKRDEEVCRQWDVLTDEDHLCHLSEKENFYYKNKWLLHLNKSGSDTLPLRKRSDFKLALFYFRTFTPGSWRRENSCPLIPERTNNGSRHGVRPLHGGNGKTLGGLLKNQKVKEEGSKVLGNERGGPLLTVLWRKLQKMAFKNSIYFVTDRSFTADSGPL